METDKQLSVGRKASPQTTVRYKTARFLKKDFTRNKSLYLMIIPILIYYIAFHYAPMYGAIIAFKEFTPAKGIVGSPWVGFTHFANFFNSHFFARILKNTLTISVTNLIVGFPAPIILALLINELRSRTYSRIVQTVTYLPHFISLVVVCGIIKDFTSDTGVISNIVAIFTGENATMLQNARLFVPIYVLSGIWQEVGWGSIIYLSALMGIDAEIYEAAKIDGASRWKQTLHVTLPGIAPTIVVMLILRMGNILNVGFEKIILLYNPVVYETADVISSFVYRKGLQEFNWSFSSAVGLFNSLVNFLFLLTANTISRKFNDSSLW